MPRTAQPAILRQGVLKRTEPVWANRAMGDERAVLELERAAPCIHLGLKQEIGAALAGFGAIAGAQLKRRLPPSVSDEGPRLPVGLAVGAADQAPRACDSARSLTGKERAIWRFVAPGPRVRIRLPPAPSQANSKPRRRPLGARLL